MSASEDEIKKVDDLVKAMVKASGGPGLGFGLMPYQKAFLTASKPMKITVNSGEFEKVIRSLAWKDELRRGRACG